MPNHCSGKTSIRYTLVLRPDVLCGGGEKKMSGHSRIPFVIYRNQLYYITSIYLRGQNGVPSMSVMSFGAEA